MPEYVDLEDFAAQLHQNGQGGDVLDFTEHEED